MNLNEDGSIIYRLVLSDKSSFRLRVSQKKPTRIRHVIVQCHGLVHRSCDEL